MSAFVAYPDELPTHSISQLISIVRAGTDEIVARRAEGLAHAWNIAGYGFRVTVGDPPIVPSPSPGGFTPGERGGGRGRGGRILIEQFPEEEGVLKTLDELAQADGPQKALDPAIWQPILAWLFQFILKWWDIDLTP